MLEQNIVHNIWSNGRWTMSQPADTNCNDWSAQQLCATIHQLTVILNHRSLARDWKGELCQTNTWISTVQFLFIERASLDTELPGLQHGQEAITWLNSFGKTNSILWSHYGEKNQIRNNYYIFIYMYILNTGPTELKETIQYRP